MLRSICLIRRKFGSALRCLFYGDEGFILLQKKYVRHGCICLSLEDLEKVSPSLDIEEYMNEQDEEDIGWSYDWFDQDPTEEVECPLELDGVQIG